MFRIFENWDGSFTIYKWGPGDDLMAGLINIVLIIIMSILTYNALEYMNLPLLSLMVAWVIATYVRSGFSRLVIYPFICYSFGSICYIVWYICEEKGLGPLSLIGWLVLAVFAVMGILLPFLEESDNYEIEFGVFIIPTALMWLGSAAYWCGLSGDSASTMMHYSDNLIKYSSYILGIILMIGTILCLIDMIRHFQAKNLIDFLNIGIGIGIIVVMLLVNRFVESALVICIIFLVLITVITVLSAIKIIPIEINPFFMLPIIILWILEPITFQIGIYQLFEIRAVSEIIYFSCTPLISALESGFSVGVLNGFSIILDSILNPVVNGILSVFGGYVDHFSTPIILVILFGYICMCIFSSLALTICKRVTK